MIQKDKTDNTKIIINEGSRTVKATVDGSSYRYSAVYQYSRGAFYSNETVISLGGINGNKLTETGTVTNENTGSYYAGTWSAVGTR